VVQDNSLIEVIKDLDILHEQFVKSDLSEARNITFADQLCSEIDLPDIGQEVFFELIFVGLLLFFIVVCAWVWNLVDSFLAHSGSKNELSTNDFIFDVKHGVHHDRSSVESLGGDKVDETYLLSFNLGDLGTLHNVFDFILKDLMERQFLVVVEHLVVLCINNLSIFYGSGHSRGLVELEQVRGCEPRTHFLWHLEQKFLHMDDSNFFDIDECQPHSVDD